MFNGNSIKIKKLYYYCLSESYNSFYIDKIICTFYIIYFQIFIICKI